LMHLQQMPLPKLVTMIQHLLILYFSFSFPPLCYYLSTLSVYPPKMRVKG
jgi:hypothetical protein